jgi:site-specific recombinase XerD
MPVHASEDQPAAERLVGSAVTPYLGGFAHWLEEQGYHPSTVRAKLRLLEELGEWLDNHGWPVTIFEEGLAETFLDERRREGQSTRSHQTSLAQFLAHLRASEVVAAAPPSPLLVQSPLAQLLGQYEKHLRAERGLTVATVTNYVPLVRHFLKERFGEGSLLLTELVPADSARFIRRQAPTMSPGRARLLVTALRSFFRFLLKQGEIKVDLAASVLAVANWRLASVPRYLGPEAVERLLSTCCRSTSTGRRNYAVLLLLARLGLRAGEVVALELGDIDWRAGEILVRGKGLLHDRLPLPSEVGEALAAYLKTDRPCSPTRRVFVCRRAPWRGFAGASSVSSIVRRACARAGLCPPNQGAHLLRHSLATGMLNRGASFAEIGELLRHRAQSSTEIYAKVDVAALRLLAQPWPGNGGGR